MFPSFFECCGALCIAERAAYAAYGVVGQLPLARAGVYERLLDRGMLEDFQKAMTAFPASAHLNDEGYRDRILDNMLNPEETHQLRIAGIVIHKARTLDDLAPATTALANVVKSAGLSFTEKALDAAANAEPVARPNSDGSVMRATAMAGTIGTVGSLVEEALPAAAELGASAIAAPIVAFVGTLLHPSPTASDDTIYDAQHLYGPNVFNKPPQDAKDKDGAKAPGKPGAEEGFQDPKTGEQWGRARKGGYGWVDAKGNVWVPTGQGDLAHSGPHWDVQGKKDFLGSVYPGGHRR